jgi:hypothetical protein
MRNWFLSLVTRAKHLVSRRVPCLARRFGRYSRLIRKVIALQGLVVSAGPFHGMKYLDDVGRSLTTKLLGSYEAELHGALEDLIARGFDVVINVGCAEGYYAVGLALALPSAKVHAFDTNPVAQEFCRRLAALNGVADRVVVGGHCTVETLAALPLDGALVVVDVEGYEVDLLDPGRAPGLRRSTVVVEFHDHFRPGASKMVMERFAPTHAIQVIRQSARDPRDYPALGSLTPKERALALDEFRTFEGKRLVQDWAVMRPK